MATVKKSMKKPELTDAEIDARVVAEAHDPAAWGDPIVVPPSKSKRPAWIDEKKRATAGTDAAPTSEAPTKRTVSAYEKRSSRNGKRSR